MDTMERLADADKAAYAKEEREEEWNEGDFDDEQIKEEPQQKLKLSAAEHIAHNRHISASNFTRK